MNAMSRRIEDLQLPTGTTQTEGAFVAIDEMVAVLTASGSSAPALERVLEILASALSLRDVRIALVEADGLLTPVAGAGAGLPPEAPSPKLKKLLSASAPAAIRVGSVKRGPGVKRGGKASQLAAPIWAEGKVIGLLSAQQQREGKGAGGQEEDLRILSLVANLIGPHLFVNRRAEKANAAPSKIGAPPKRNAGPELKPDAGKIVGESAALKTALEQARKIARTNLTVLLRGESGAGKELFAQAIHDHSSRSGKPFIKVNCAALPETILESELFGHERGAFTGAVARRKGRFELADGGTLLLDEIGDIPPSFQAKLLRVLQEGEFERVGGSKTLKVDVRVIAATHCDLEAATAKKTLRADLYYRLGVAPIHVPPLRERKDDIPMLAQHILSRFNAENDRAMTFHPGSIELLCKCAFPGNVRELENCVRAAAAMAREAQIVEKDFACRNRSCFTSRLRRARFSEHASRQRRLALAT
jgi:Nif-specific regulatory protein